MLDVSVTRTLSEPRICVPAMRVPASLLGILGSHEEQIRAYFPENDFTSIDLPDGIRVLFLCFTNRCGSNFLAETLASTGRINKALESFNGDEVENHARREGHCSFAAYFSWLVRANAVAGCFAVKVSLDQLVMLAREGVIDRIAGRSQFILMQREDALGQAISIAIAEQNNVWAYYLEPTRPDSDLEYSFDKLVELLDWIAGANAAFAKLFAFNGLSPRTVIYEHLLTYSQLQIDWIGVRLGWPFARINLSRVELKRQSGAINRAWRERFLADWRSRG